MTQHYNSNISQVCLYNITVIVISVHITAVTEQLASHGLHPMGLLATYMCHLFNARQPVPGFMPATLEHSNNELINRRDHSSEFTCLLLYHLF